jgi:hypothetical protein
MQYLLSRAHQYIARHPPEMLVKLPDVPTATRTLVESRYNLGISAHRSAAFSLYPRFERALIAREPWNDQVLVAIPCLHG